jgi:hypothetical protein
MEYLCMNLYLVEVELCQNLVSCVKTRDAAWEAATPSVVSNLSARCCIVLKLAARGEAGAEVLQHCAECCQVVCYVLLEVFEQVLTHTFVEKESTLHFCLNQQTTFVIYKEISF